MKTAGGRGPNSGNAVATDSSGNFYVSGSFGSRGEGGTIDLGGTNLTSQGETDGFVAKFNIQGQCLWARQVAGLEENDVYDIVMRSDGTILVTGEFLGTNAIGGTSVTSQGGYDIFLAAFTPAGDLLWMRRIGGALDEFALALAPAANGSALFSGSFIGDIDLGGGITFSSADDDALLIKLDTTGAVQWARRAGGDGAQFGSDVKVDSQGNIIWAGEFETNIVLGATTLSSPGFNIFMCKFDSTGNHLSARKLGDGDEAELPRIALGPNGRVICTAVYAGQYAIGSQTLPDGLSDVLIASFDAAGALEWVHTFGGAELDVCTELLVDGSGDYYLVGYFRGLMPIGNTNLTSAGNLDIFVARYSPSGQFEGAVSGGGFAVDLAFSAAFGPSGEIRLAGYFSATAHFGSISVTSPDLLPKMVVATLSHPPTLRITSFPAHVLLSWPGHFTNLKLQTKRELSAPSWDPVSSSPVLYNDELVVTNSVSDPARFFRLSN